jgi:hypothetical protein
LCSRGDSLVGGGDYVVGEVDQSTPGRLRQRNQLVGGDLAGRGPADTLKSGLALLNRDLRLTLRPHADGPRGSSQARMIRRGVADDVADVDGRNHGQMKRLDRPGKVETDSELFGCGPCRLVGGGRRDRGADFARSRDQRGVGAAGWAGELAPAFGRAAPGNLVALNAGASRSTMPLAIAPFLAAASVMMPVVLEMRACTRATRTRSAGSGLPAKVRCA